MEDEDEVPQSSVNFIPCLYFLKKAVAKEKPEKVSPIIMWNTLSSMQIMNWSFEFQITLTQEELARVINETKAELEE